MGTGKHCKFKVEHKPVILFITSILSNIYLENLHDTPFIDETSTAVHKKLNLDNQPRKGSERRMHLQGSRC